MKISLPIILCGILLNVRTISKAQVFTENFDSGSVNMTSAGVPGFSVTNAYSNSLPNSIHGAFDVGTTATLTSPDFSTIGNQYVTLQFNHICKTSFFDSCVIELSVNSGITWIPLNSTTCTYLGASPNFSTTKWFGAFSYPVWDINNAATMSNSWWKPELFDISNLCANQSAVRIRFRMRDNGGNGMENFYGWVLDDIAVNVSACELQPPSVNILQGPAGIVYPPVNTTVSAYLNDNSGNITASQLFYSINNQSFFALPFNNVSDSTYTGNLPVVNIGDTVCWFVQAMDVCLNVTFSATTCYYVNAAPCDIVPPLINIFQGPFATVSTPDADTVKVYITDNTNIIIGPMLAYQINSGSFTYLPLTNISDSIYTGVLPAVNTGDVVCWGVLAYDTCNNFGSTPLNCFTALYPDTLPYFDNFESGSVGWFSQTTSGSSWQLGLPLFGATTGTHSGNNAWDVELVNAYFDNTDSRLISPIYDFTGDSNATVSFWQNYYTEANWDGVRMEYSTDGVFWNVLGFVGDPNAINWYDVPSINSSGLPAWNNQSPGWIKSSYNLSAFNNAPFMQFRFVFTSDASVTRDGHSIDDFNIRVPVPVDGGVESILSPIGFVQGNTGVPVTLSIKNFGSQILTSMNVGVRVNNNAVQTQTWSGVLLPGQTTIINTIFNISLPPGNNTVCAWAVPVGDGDATNDTTCTQVYGIPSANIPYSNNFENNGNDWYAPISSNPSTQWQLGTPVFGLTTGAHSPDTCWDINLTGPYGAGATTYLLSPYFNISGINAFRLGFWLNQQVEVNDGVWIEYDFDDSGTWSPLGVVADPNGINWYNGTYLGHGAWMGGSSGWKKVEYTMLGLGAHTTVAFRIVFASDLVPSGLNTGVSVDDFTLNLIAPQDAGIITFYSLNVFPAGSTAPSWQVTIRNYGSLSVSNVPVTITLNSVIINTFIYPGTIAAGDSAVVTVNGYTVPSGVSDLCAYTALTGDGDATNDGNCMMITGVPVITPLYTDNFDNGNVGWTSVTTGDPATNWELGPPNFGLTNNAHSAPDCWDINLNTLYGVNAECYLYSPYFDFTNAFSPYVSFWQNYNTEPGWDGVRLEYSFSGSPWSVLGFMGDPNAVNWYTAPSINSSLLPAWVGQSTGWIESKYDLNIFPPTPTLQFRFVFTSDASVVSDGYSIDDFTLFSAYSLDVGVKSVVTPEPNAGAPLYTPVVLRVKNFGYTPTGNFDVTYIANGSSPVTVNYSNTLQAGDSADVSLTGFTTQPGINTLKAYTSMGSDLYHPNDTLNYTFFAVFTTTPPYIDPFDAGNIGWTVDTSVTGTKWELGVPAFGTTNSVHSGGACWDVNLDAPYSNAATTRLISPMFNYVNSLSSTLKIWVNYNMEYGQDGMRVDYTTDGVNYTPLGTFNDPNGTNWYDHSSVVAFGTPAWSGNSLGWKQAIYNTSAFSGSSYIKYAFVFRSDFNLSGDGVSVDDFELTSIVGMNELSKTAQVLLQPNPATDVLTISVTSSSRNDLCDGNNLTFYIADAIGREVITQQTACENNLVKTHINVSSLAAGVYFINLSTSKGVLVQKFIKQ